jgi:hypothetical protein
MVDLNLQIARGEEGTKLHTRGPEALGATRIAIDHTDGVLHDGAEGAQVLARDNNLPAGCDDIFYDEQTASTHLGAFGQAAGAVVLRTLPHEHAGESGLQGERRRDRNAAKLQSGEQLSRGMHERGEFLDDRVQEPWVAFEPVLVEILGRQRAGTQPKRAFQSCAGSNRCRNFQAGHLRDSRRNI